MNCVTLAQSRAFCAWAGGRLPDEAEWIWAAGGRAGALFPWGDSPPSCSKAVIFDDARGWACGTETVHPPCSRQEGTSPEGVCDLVGNVWERVERCGANRAEHCAHGGSGGYPWHGTLLNAARAIGPGEDRADDVGIRCVRDLNPAAPATPAGPAATPAGPPPRPG